MKKFLASLLISAFLFPLALFAQPSKYVKLGVNYSSFRTEGGKSKPGLTFGVGKNCYPIQNFRGSWGIEVGYTKEKILLEHKTWPTNFFPPYSGVVNGGFEVSLSYLDLSMYLGYFLNAQKAVNFEVFVGPSLSLPVGNSTKGTDSEIIYLAPDEISRFDFDFYHYDADPGPALLPFMERGMNLNTSMIVGTKLHWKHVHLSLSYSRAISKTEGIISLTLFDKIDRFSVSVGIDF